MFSALISLALSNLLYFALHIEGNGAFPKPLSAEMEREYFKLKQQGDMNARNKLIEHNLRLVAHISKKYYSTTNDQDDLISIGTIGLIKAVNTFSYEKGTKFATYAARCIEKATRSQRLYLNKKKECTLLYLVIGKFGVRATSNCIFYVEVITARLPMCQCICILSLFLFQRQERKQKNLICDIEILKALR